MVKDGYKQTEIGLIPKDWGIKSYDELFTFLTTATYSRSQLSEDGNIQYLHYGDIHTKYHFILDFKNNKLPTIKNELLKKYPLLQDGDIVMADASEDYQGICKSVEIINIEDKKVISGLHTFLLRDKDENFINGFKAYLSSNNLIRSQFNSLATGMKVYGVSKGNLRNILIPIPPKEEQKAIASALSDVDGLITSLEKLIAKKESIKTATMQQLLTGKKRLDGFSGEWEEKRLGDLCGTITTGKLDANAMKKDGEYRFYTCAKEFYYIDHYAFNNEALLVSGNGANVGYIHYYNGKFNAYQRTYVLLNFNQDIHFIKLLMDISLSKRIRTEVNSGNTPYITMDTLTDMLVLMPKNLKEQQAIAQILSDMNNEIEALKTKLLKTKAIKDGMMSELLSGKTRLKGVKDE